ncbi:phosphatase domain-containing protein [uncultured Gelidibacter sp.]|uniref:App1 family protein n=1 Tax=uncultured Gelidibacter sp. TaxID=259318 RepID=UPI002603AA49|nr:phosphatase domain-containing protein [uncultured Gelidibacter sp.]
MGLFKKDPLQVIVFQSYGTSSHLYVRGRALEDESIDLEGKHPIKLLINAYKRFETDEIRNTTLLLKLPNGRIFETVTDDKGYFLVDFNIEGLDELTNEEGWLSFELAYKDFTNTRVIQLENRFPGEMLIPSEQISFGVASDIDDTILHTGLVSILKWRVIYNTFLKRASKRSPLEGAAEFYHQLHRGKSGEEANPIFYVSHSPWNMYRYLEFFLKKNNFPKGPILLRDFGNFLNRKKNAEKPQKQREILNILKTYPELKLILIGDSGERDADIYLEIAELYPDRILAIYLRSVKHKKKMFRVKSLYENYKTVPVLLVNSSKEAIEHARENGFIA